MTAQELDTMMQSILIDALQADWSNDIEATPPVAPSVKYRRWERAILVDPFRWYRRKMRPHWKKCLQNIAAVLLVVLLSFATLMAVSPTARATVVKWFEVQRENYIEYFFTDVSPEKDHLLAEYSPTWVEEGYTIVEAEPQFAGMKNVYYENEEGTPLLFGYLSMRASNGSRVDTENMTMSDVTVNGFDGQLFLSDDPEVSNYLVWMDEEHNVQFYIDGFMNKSDLLHMANSVIIVK